MTMKAQPRSKAATGSTRLGVPSTATTVLRWGDEYAVPGGGPPRVQVHIPCGHDAHPQLHCSYCGEPIGPGELQSRPGPGATPKQLADGILPRA